MGRTIRNNDTSFDDADLDLDLDLDLADDSEDDLDVDLDEIDEYDPEDSYLDTHWEDQFEYGV